MAMPKGFRPTSIVASTELLARPMTDTLPLSKFVTYRRPCTASTAIWSGRLPVGTVAITVSVVVSITDTSLLP
jgi:hypothetical protein